MKNISLLFVYGSLKKGFFNEGYLASQKLIATDVKTTEFFKMYPCTEYFFPYLFKSDSYSGGVKVLGELYEVSNDFLINTLDVLEDVANLTYTRELIEIELKNDVSRNSYVYIANNNLLESEDIDIIPTSLIQWDKKHESIGTKAHIYIESNKELYGL